MMPMTYTACPDCIKQWLDNLPRHQWAKSYGEPVIDTPCPECGVTYKGKDEK